MKKGLANEVYRVDPDDELVASGNCKVNLIGMKISRDMVVTHTADFVLAE